MPNFQLSNEQKLKIELIAPFIGLIGYGMVVTALPIIGSVSLINKLTGAKNTEDDSWTPFLIKSGVVTLLGGYYAFKAHQINQLLDTQPQAHKKHAHNHRSSRQKKCTKSHFDGKTPENNLNSEPHESDFDRQLKNIHRLWDERDAKAKAQQDYDEAVSPKQLLSTPLPTKTC